MNLREFFLYGISVKLFIIPVLLLLLVSFPACEDEFYETMEAEGYYYLDDFGLNRVYFMIPDSGQSTGYTAVFGEDADYINIPREISLSDNGDGTVTDHVTGLMWQKCSYPDTSSDCSGSPQVYDWDVAKANCEGMTLDGYDDWRMPSISELFSIIDVGQAGGAYDSSIFIDIQHDGTLAFSVTNGYWSTTEIISDSVFYIHFWDGWINVIDLSASPPQYFVKCVRLDK